MVERPTGQSFAHSHSVSRTIGRKVGMPLTTLAFVLLSVLATSGAASAASSASDIRELYKVFGIGSKPVNHVLVVDESLSMKDVFPTVRTAVRQYLRTIGPKDNVEVIVFGSGATLLDTGTGKSARKIADRLPAPNTVNGQNTDIAAALDAATSQMDRSRDDTQVVVVLTDGEDDPPDNTPFPRTAGLWKQLRKRFQSAARGKDVFAFAVALGQKGLPGAAIVREVVPGAESFAVEPPALPGYFAGIREKVRNQQLGRALTEEFKKGGVKATVAAAPDAAVSNGSVQLARVTVRNGFAHLPATVTVVTSSKPGAWSGRTVVPADKLAVGGVKKRMTLAPGEEKSIDVASGDVTVDTPRFPMSLVPGRSSIDVVTEAAGSGTTAYASGVDAMGFDPALSIKAPVAKTVLTKSWGLPWWLVGVLAALVVLVLFLLFRWLWKVVVKPAAVEVEARISQNGRPLGTGRAAGSVVALGGTAGESTIALSGIDAPACQIEAVKQGSSSAPYLKVLKLAQVRSWDVRSAKWVPAASGPMSGPMRLKIGELEVAVTVRAK